MRLARQDVLRSNPPLELSAVLDEAVLRRTVGGPEVMARQLRHGCGRPRTFLKCGFRYCRSPPGRISESPGPFVIFSFPNTSDLDVVVLDHLTSSLYLERKEDLQAYSEAFDALQIHALSPEDSLDFIAGIS